MTIKHLEMGGGYLVPSSYRFHAALRGLRGAIVALSLLFGTFAPLTLGAATATDRMELEQYQKLKENRYFKTAEGVGDSRDEAVRSAMQNLQFSISASVSSSISQESVEDASGLKNNIKATSTISSRPITFTGMEQAAFQDEKGNWHAVVGVPENEIEKIYRKREDNVVQRWANAKRYLQQRRVDEALTSLYDAYAECVASRRPDEIKVESDSFEMVDALEAIPAKIREVCNDVTLDIVEDDGEGHATVSAKYRGDNIAGLAYALEGQEGEPTVYRATDGTGPLDLPAGNTAPMLSLRLVFNHQGESVDNPDLAAVLSRFDGLRLPQAVKSVAAGRNVLKANKEQVKAFKEEMAERSDAGLANAAKNISADCQKAMDRVMTAISNHNLVSVKDLFTSDGYAMFERLMGYGKARIVGKKVNLQFYPYGERTVCRSVPMSFSFPKSARKFMEEVTFTFDKEGKIESLAFSLGQTARECIFSHGEEWTPMQKMTVACFLENYKTAFALNRIDYLREIFDKDALIIVGHQVKKLTRKGSGDVSGFGIETESTYTKLDKEQYLKNLERAMMSNEFINISFSENDIRQSNVREGIFGIQITQDYASQHYSDHGYLFLLVDLAEPDEPVIHVRTWQQERNPDITPEIQDPDDPEFGRYTLGRFQL